MPLQKSVRTDDDKLHVFPETTKPGLRGRLAPWQVEACFPKGGSFAYRVRCLKDDLRIAIDHPATLLRMDINQIVTELTAERNRIDQAIAALQGSDGSSRPRRGRPPKAQSSEAAPRQRTMSPAARKRISAAMKLRWAQRLGKSAPKKAAAPAKKAFARKPMSPAARKKLSALAKARWAKAKKAGAKAL